MTNTILEFGDFRLDPDHFELCRAGQPLKLERKPMELLILLATREGDIVTREEIVERLWGSEVFVDTKHGINAAIRKVTSWTTTPTSLASSIPSPAAATASWAQSS